MELVEKRLISERNVEKLDTSPFYLSPSRFRAWTSFPTPITPLEVGILQGVPISA
jgi:hypothetical protein